MPLVPFLLFDPRFCGLFAPPLTIKPTLDTGDTRGVPPSQENGRNPHPCRSKVAVKQKSLPHDFRYFYRADLRMVSKNKSEGSYPFLYLDHQLPLLMEI